MTSPSFGQPFELAKPGLGTLLERLRARGYRLIGPRLESGAIGYAEIRGIEDLPVGISDRQSPGSYRTEQRSDGALFGYAAGARSLRGFFQPGRSQLVSLRRGANGPTLASHEPRPGRVALIGVPSCDIAGLGVLDRVTLGGAYPDPRYRARREGAFVVAVNCSEPSGTCFCASMGTGPRAESGYDIALTELAGSEHRFVARAGSELGAELLRGLELGLASVEDLARDLEISEGAKAKMGRRLEERGVREALLANLEHPAWDDVASRCLACTNCTLVCPTCFCTTPEDSLDVDGDDAERSSRHDSCFGLEYSHLHGGSVRSSVKSRYRQWLTHKFATWYDQFGSSGCVGCGRCITFCPVGIDVTEELARIRGDHRAA